MHLYDDWRYIFVCLYFPFFAAFVFWDTPFGLRLTKDDIDDWDKLLSDSELKNFFTFLGLTNKTEEFTLAMVVHPRQYGRIYDAMAANSFTNIHTVYVYKCQNNGRGTNQWIPSVEMVIVGYKPNRNACKPMFLNREHPLDRHNIIFCPNTGAKLMRSDGKQVNVSQKNPFLAYSLAQVHCPAGSRALVIGAGSGSDVIGFVRAGISVTCVEKSKVQFPYLKTRLNHESVSNLQGVEKCLDAAACSDKLREFCKDFMNLAIGEAETKKAAKKAARLARKEAEKKAKQAKQRANAASKEKSPAPTVSPADAVCALCGEPISKADGVPCSLPSCGVVVGKGCCLEDTVKCDKALDDYPEHAPCDAIFCTPECHLAHIEG